jgi:hypothetical protein
MTRYCVVRNRVFSAQRYYSVRAVDSIAPWWANTPTDYERADRIARYLTSRSRRGHERRRTR